MAAAAPRTARSGKRGRSDAPPLTAQEFADRFDALGPTEPRPKLAVAVSGGADSLALVHLAWGLVQARGGSLHTLTVDHGLRDGSGHEAATVGQWMRAIGIPHTILRWEGAKPPGNLQATARRARYDLLDRWCGGHGVLHLLTAHHAGDQAETRVLRLSRRAAAAGLAGMSAVEELDRCRILRPLLTVDRARLEATLRTQGQNWIDDPSNLDSRFDRVRVRGGLSRATGTLGPDTNGDAFAALRAIQDDEIARLLAGACAVTPFGEAYLESAPFRAAGPALAARALGAVLATVGGGSYPPRHDRLRATIDNWLPDARQPDTSPRPLATRTLGGCRLAPGPRGSLVVTREAGRIDHLIALTPGADFLWDGRFRLRTGDTCQGLTAARVTDTAWREMCRALPWIDRAGLSQATRTALPGIYRDGQIMGLPLLDAWVERPGQPATAAGMAPVSAAFAPRRALTRAGFVAATNLVCQTTSVV